MSIASILPMLVAQHILLHKQGNQAGKISVNYFSDKRNNVAVARFEYRVIVTTYGTPINYVINKLNHDFIKFACL